MGAGGIFPNADQWETSETPINDTLIEFYIIYVPDLTTLPQPVGRPKTDYTGKLAALKGSLSLCAHTYNSSMQFGVTNTTMQGQETHLPWSHGSATDDNNMDGYLASVSGTPDTLFMNPTSKNGLSAWLITSVFNGTVAMPPPPPAPTKGPDPDSLLVTTNNGPAIFSTVASKQVALALYGNETGTRVKDGVNAMSILLDNVAMSMSNGFRTTSTTLTNQTGTSYTTEIYFQVSWPWLIVPILSIPITLLFFALTLFRSRRGHIPAWKSSRLAALHALDPSLRAQLGGGMAKNSELERLKGVDVRLSEVKPGRWELGDR